MSLTDRPVEIGQPPWSRAELLEGLSEFAELYRHRPIGRNAGGMLSPQMFGAWFIAKKTSPRFIVESGVWLGQSTWLFEQACPDARLFSIDINLRRRRYISESATYFDQDFSKLDWSFINGNSSLVFFDDHTDAVERVKLCQRLGFQKIIFEDNYPVGRGDCRSLKQVFEQHPTNNWELKEWLVQRIDVYAEFPPVFKHHETRWGDTWGSQYPTPESLLTTVEDGRHQIFWDEALSYTWLAYVQISETCHK